MLSKRICSKLVLHGKQIKEYLKLKTIETEWLLENSKEVEELPEGEDLIRFEPR
jgi:hypothetical protein